MDRNLALSRRGFIGLGASAAALSPLVGLSGHALAQATPDVCGLRLYVERDNANAQRTYESLGMRDAGYAMYEAEFGRS